MTFVGCSVLERFVNPLFEVFDGGDFVLSSYRDIEEDVTRMRIYFEDASRVEDAKRCLKTALSIVGVEVEIEVGEIADEDWKFAYRRHFKTEPIGRRILVVPTWERETADVGSREMIVLDPGMAFGTGKHETTRACLEFIDELAPGKSFLDMGCGSGILSIAAAKLGFERVDGFDVDQEAVDASMENAKLNEVRVNYRKFALGRAYEKDAVVEKYELVAANILGPLLIKFADEIIRYVGSQLIISGILNDIYEDVLAAYISRGFREVNRKSIGEWTTGLVERVGVR